MTPRPLVPLGLVLLCGLATPAAIAAPARPTAGTGAYIAGVRDTGQFLPDTTLLARVGPRLIRARDFVSAYFSSYAEFRPRPDSAGRLEFLDNMITKDVLALTALAVDHPLGFEERVVMNEHTQRVLANVLYRRSVTDSVVVTEDEIQKVYQQMGYEQHFRQIVLGDRATAERVRDLLTRGRLTWTEALRTYGTPQGDPRHEGDLGFIPRSTLDLDLAMQIYPLKRGEISPVIADGNGFHLIQSVERRTVNPPDYSGARGVILSVLRNHHAAQLAERMRSQMAARIGMRYDTTNVRWAASHFLDTPLFRLEAGGMVLDEETEPAFAPIDTARVLARHDEGQLTLGGFLKVYTRVPATFRPRIGNFEAFRGQIAAIVLEPRMALLATERGFGRDSMAVAQIEKRREELVVERLYQDSVASRVRVTDKERRRYYQDHVASFRTFPKVRYAALVRDSKAAADSLAARLMAGERAEDVIRADSLRGLPTGPIRERRQDEPGPYHKILFEELRPGRATVIGPDQEFTWLVLQVLEHDPGRQLSYEESEHIVDESVQNIDAEERLKALVERLKKRYRVESRPELVMRVRLADPTLQ
jgi:parvulin-like peptidyl-prolyl cis-trans isomerase-like protein